MTSEVSGLKRRRGFIALARSGKAPLDAVVRTRLRVLFAAFCHSMLDFINAIHRLETGKIITPQHSLLLPPLAEANTG